MVSKRFVIFDDHKTGIFRTRPLGVEGMYAVKMSNWNHIIFFFILHSQGYRIPITNWILETDYDTYSVRYSCYNKSSDSHRKSRRDMNIALY